MKQKNSRMIAEVNKIIGNTLIKDGGVYLPNIGSLSVVTTHPSMGEATNSSAAPTRTVSLIDEERHHPLTTIISERGNCTPNQATIIYKKWVEAVSDKSQIKIEGVGTIIDGLFTSSDSLLQQLNPVVAKPKERPCVNPKKVDKSDKQNKSKGSETKNRRIALVAWLLLVAVVAVAAVVILNNKNGSQSAVTVPIVSPKTEVANPTTEPVIEPIETESVTEDTPESVEKDVVVSTTKEMTADEILQAGLQAGTANRELHYKVIYGAFSNSQNVAKAIAQATKAMDGKVSCTVYRHGKSYIVSLFDAQSFNEANEFIAINKDRFNETLWIHKR